MTRHQENLFVAEIIDMMASQALESAGDSPVLAIEKFSSGVDRLLAWLPADRRSAARDLARAHSYCSPGEIEKMRGEAISGKIL